MRRLPASRKMLCVAALGAVLLAGGDAPATAAPRQTYVPKFPACGPETEVATDVHRAGDPHTEELPPLDFCARWNPEFAFNGNHCCGNLRTMMRSRRKPRCSTKRPRGSYCTEVLPEQKEYAERMKRGEYGDALKLITRDMGRKGKQAYCTVNNGFLAWGRPLVASEVNRVQIRSPHKCTEYGTDPMIAMLEWLGRQVAKDYPGSEYAGTRLLVGDIAAPRGGCLSGAGGKRGHLSHANGQDVDIGFLVAKPKRASPGNFHRDFDLKQNWPLLKQILKNPYACVKVVFLDRRIIRKLAKFARKEKDEDWGRFQRFIRHTPAHRNHYHVRIGEWPGPPGCVADAKPELETGESPDGEESLMDTLTGGSEGQKEAQEEEE